MAKDTILYTTFYFDQYKRLHDVTFHARNAVHARRLVHRMFPRSTVDIVAIGPTVGGRQRDDGIIII